MKKKKKSSTKSKKATPTLPPFEFEIPSAQELNKAYPSFLKVKICCAGLPHLNFEWPAVPCDLTVGYLKEAISKRHGGSLPPLVLYRDKVLPDNRLQLDDTQQLTDVGLVGEPYQPGVELPCLTLWYDFSAPLAECPIAFVEPDPLTSKHKVPLKEYMRLEAKRAG